MSEARIFFRHCPSCGRRFEIRLVSKERADSSSIVGTEMVNQPVGSSRPVIVEESVPYLVDIEEFQYTYKCKHCGHEWSEVREKEYAVKEPKGYKGD